MSSDRENLTWDDVSEGGKLVDYVQQKYIKHLWDRSYVAKKDNRIIKDNNYKDNRMKLQILVTQYKEKKDVIKPLLDSIALQQGIDLNEVGVIIVNDGYPQSKLPQKFIDQYPFKIEYFMEKHRGVSGTRNSALDHATAEYVMFCDCDDMFYSMFGIHVIFLEMEREINGMKGFNSLTTKFYEENYNKETKKTVFVEHKFDRTFVHGKVHRRSYLVENNIRFNDNLTVHEDSYFNVLATTLAVPDDTIRYSDQACYLWKWRDDSVCRHDPLYMQKTYKNYIDSNQALVDEYLRREKVDNANQFICVMMFDTYYLMNTDDWLKQDNQEYRLDTEKRFKQYYLTNCERFNNLPVAYRVQVSNQVRANNIKKGMQMEKQTFDQWIEYIKGL